MNYEKFTRGPWQSHERFIYANGSVDTFSGVVVGCIAVCEDTHQTDADGRNWATNGDPSCNATLIAAAPELLEALQVCERLLTGVSYTDYPVEEELLLVRYAISKALGDA